MTYEEFKIALTAEVVNLVGKEVSVTIHKVQKNNGVLLDAISIIWPETCISPSVYLEPLYEQFQNGDYLCELAHTAIQLAKENPLTGILPDDFFMSYEKVKRRVCYRLVNYEKNEEFLKEIPHDKVLDLAVIYYYSVEPEYLSNASVLIRNIDLQRWNVSAEEVREDAKRNTPYLFDWQLITIWDLMEQMLLDRGVELPSELKEDDSVTMYILTNKEKYFGAACILYPHVLETIAERLKSHFFILPSSIHECIIMPASGLFTQESLSKMITEINKSQVDEIEILSDQAYYYDRDMKKVTW